MTTTASGSDASIRNVSDTARWVAVYRAMESERPDAIFNDPFARRLAGERGERIVRELPKAAASAWAMVVRTAVMDELILRKVERDGVRTIVNLAAGLDARAYRLKLPPSVRWLHVDLPDMTAYVEQQLDGTKPVCALEYVAADLTRPDELAAVLDRVEHAGGPALAITEGLLVYLQPESVAALARAMASRPTLRSWILDIASPRLLEMLKQRWEPMRAAGASPMIFGPAEGTNFFEPFGWREAEFRSLWDESIRLDRMMPRGWIYKLLTRFVSEKRREEGRRMSGIVLLDRV